MGSGEMSETMGKVHRYLLGKCTSSPINAIFLDSPAGFQLNCEDISAKAVNYFRKHFSIDLEVVSFKNAILDSDRIEIVAEKIKNANYIFAGPGSPTYAAKQWRNNLVEEALKFSLKNGAILCFASAAAISLSKYVIPVYEIYKVGIDIHWQEGIDILSPYFGEFAIIPHWNNKEGGNHDTSRAYIGQTRFTKMIKLLPNSVKILGIDEYTACVFNFDANQIEIYGAGKSTLIINGKEEQLTKDKKYSFNIIKNRTEEISDNYRNNQPKELISIIPEKTKYNKIPEMRKTNLQERELSELEIQLIQIIVDIRSELRSNSLWHLSDSIRKRLNILGITIEDHPSKSTWKFNPLRSKKQ